MKRTRSKLVGMMAEKKNEKKLANRISRGAGEPNFGEYIA